MNKIANGHNNEIWLSEIADLDPPLFREFRSDLLTEWSDAESWVQNGLDELVPIGLPADNWIFYRLSPVELQYLKSNFGTQVTIYTYDKGNHAWKTFNATLFAIRIMEKGAGSARWEMDEWFDVKLEFKNLVEI